MANNLAKFLQKLEEDSDFQEKWLAEQNSHGLKINDENFSEHVEFIVKFAKKAGLSFTADDLKNLVDEEKLSADELDAVAGGEYDIKVGKAKKVEVTEIDNKKIESENFKETQTEVVTVEKCNLFSW